MKIIRIIILVIMCCFLSRTNVYANDELNGLSGFDLNDYDFNSIQRIIDDNDSKMNFKDTANQLKSGNTSIFSSIVIKAKDTITNEFSKSGNIMVKIIGLAIASSIIAGFSNIFGNNQISSTGFSIVYMLMIIVLMSGFTLVIKMATDILVVLVDFMKTLMPVYFMAVGVSGNVNGALAFYELTMIMVTIIEWLFLNVFIPIVKIYVVVTLIDYMTKERLVSKLSELLKKFLQWIMKTSIAAVAGINVIEGMVMPSADSVTVSAFSKFTSIIPGIGSSANSVAGLTLGAGTLIKNTIGAAGLVAIIVIAIVPAVKIGASCATYHIISAVLQPVADKRITECISSVGTGMGLLFKMILTSAFLLIITIAIICISTNATYYAVS